MSEVGILLFAAYTVNFMAALVSERWGRAGIVIKEPEAMEMKNGFLLRVQTEAVLPQSFKGGLHEMINGGAGEVAQWLECWCSYGGFQDSDEDLAPSPGGSRVLF